MDKVLLSDTNGNKSVTVTAFIVGFIVVNVKLLFAGMTILGVTMSSFSGSEYGIAIAALGAVYVLRRNAKDKSDSEKE